MRTIAAALPAILVLAVLASAQTDSFMNQGTMRTFIVHVPTGTATPPLVINMHGLGSYASQQQMLTGFDAISNREKFVVVYPNGTGNTWDITGSVDVNFISALIDTLSRRYSIDLRRVYATGFSMGGYMSHRLGCALAQRIAAIAPVSGLNASSFSCSPPRGISVLQIHGTADTIVRYSGVATTVSGWVTRNACPATPVTTDPYPATNPSSVVRKDYYGIGRDSSEVILLTLDGEEHTWAGAPWGGATDDIIASEEIWAFFKRHALPASSVGPRMMGAARVRNMQTQPRLCLQPNGGVLISDAASRRSFRLDGRGVVPVVW